MRQTARLGLVAAAIVVAAPLSASVGPGAGSAGADGIHTGGGTFMPFTQKDRRCDYTTMKYNGPTGYGIPTAVVTSDGTTVVADVEIVAASPNAYFDVRLIQAPQPSSLPCNGGDPGVAEGAVTTDGAGDAAITLSDTIEPGATGAWVSITRPNPFSQIPAEFYTTTFIAKL